MNKSEFKELVEEKTTEMAENEEKYNDTIVAGAIELKRKILQDLK